MSRGDNFGTCFYALRKQSDLQLIRCVQDISRNSYFVKAPLHQLTLFFKEQETEKEYRATAHKIHEKRADGPATLSTSRYGVKHVLLIYFLPLSLMLFLFYHNFSLFLFSFAFPFSLFLYFFFPHFYLFILILCLNI